MFKTIYKYELKYWAKQFSVYIYAAIFLGLATLLMAVATDVFEESSEQGSIGNAPFRIYDGMRFFGKFILFLLPIIFGGAVYRDFKTNMHSVLYSFPFNKRDYLLAKFLSAFTVMVFIVSMIGIGFIIGAHFLGAPTDKIVAFNSLPYLKGYGLYILPNILLFGSIVFAVVSLSRNIYSGFIAVIIVLFLQQILMRVLPSIDSLFVVAVLEPFGEVALSIATRYWTADEKNQLALPMVNSLIVNRLVWLSMAGGIFFMLYKYFSFSQSALVFNFRKNKGEALKKNNFGSVEKVEIQSVAYDFSLMQNLKNTWHLSNVDFRYIIKSWAFRILCLMGLLLVVFMTAQMNRQYGGKLLPVTWLMLAFPVFFFSMVINLLTFLYAGMLVHRSRIASINQLVDVTPIPNWVLLFSKFIALVKMQMILLLLVMIGGVLVQTFNGYYHYEIGHYIGTLYGLYLPSFVIWALVALWVQTLLKNPYLGMFLLFMGSFALGGLKDIGLEQTLFNFNETPDGTIVLSYSDLLGYGASLAPFFVYKFYWLLFGIFMLLWALLLWTRGLPHSLVERLQIMKSRFRGRTAIGMVAFLVAFLALGCRLYYEENVVNTFYSKKEKAALKKEIDKKYQHFQNTPQPRMVDLDINMNIYPYKQRFEADGKYILVNKTNQILDTLLIEYAEDIITKYEINRTVNLVSKDALARFDVWTLEKGLAPNDSMELSFAISTKDNTIFRKNNIVEQNGTYLHSLNFPSIGWWRTATMPTDSAGLGNMYRSKDADFVDFKATVSTAENQIAIAPGYLQKEWTEGNRRFFQYQSTNKVTNDFIFNSGKFEMVKDKWREVDLAIYYHPDHAYNLAVMMEGMKAGLEYCSDNFAPYQHQKLTIVEFARSLGGFAQSFANTMPFSEASFLRDVADPEEEIIADLFSGTAHEVAHQWWGHQVIPANARGSIMLTEGMSEYVKAKVLEHYRGKDQLYKFLEKSRISYLRSAANDAKEEPLMYNKGQSQGYIPYQKGMLVFYAMSDYLGDEKFHAALRKYIQKVRFKEAPYTTSIEMVEHIKAATPDSLKYLITDLFETITLYDNQMTAAKVTTLPNGKYQVDLSFLVKKYRRGEKDKPLPLKDYLDIGIFGEDGQELYLRKHKVTQQDNQLTLIIDAKPMEVGVDPYVKMIDREGKDNRKTL